MPQASAQLVKDKTAGTWTSMFPNEQVTETQSLVYVKKLLAVTVSSISYLRGIFPNDAFGDRCIGDLSLKILRDDSGCKAASQVITWMKGCFDALKKKYLKTLVLGIYTDPEKPDNVIESYTFKFSYDNNTANMDVYRNEEKVSGGAGYSAEQTKKATIHLLRNLVLLTHTLGVLPDDVLIGMKLTYYDEMTPTEYEPPGFRASETDSFVFDDETTNIRVGEASTNFHSIRLRLKTGNRDYVQMAASQNEESQQEMETCVVEETVKGKKGQNERVPGPAGDAPKDGDQEQDVVCPCDCNEDDGLMISCEICRKWQHGLCFKICDEKDAPSKHFCNVCAPKVKTPCTDPLLEGLDIETVKYACLWRRTLEACKEPVNWGVSTLAKRLGCPMTNAHFLMSRLEQEGVMAGVSGKGKRRGARQVNKEKLTVALNRFVSGRELLRLSNAEVNVTAEASQRFDSQMGDGHQTQMDDLTEMTDSMSVAAEKTRTRDRTHKNKSDKRLVSKRGATTFELEDSQDPDADFDTGKKRRKASKAM